MPLGAHAISDGDVPIPSNANPERNQGGTGMHNHIDEIVDHTMADIQSRNHDNKAINLILEFSIGKVNKVIDDMVSLIMD